MVFVPAWVKAQCPSLYCSWKAELTVPVWATTSAKVLGSAGITTLDEPLKVTTTGVASVAGEPAAACAARVTASKVTGLVE